eukprot:SAG31_NODE_24480_length_480_cov_1.186352_1_plen_86_part_01
MLMMGGSGLVGNAITINFAPVAESSTGSSSGSDGGFEVVQSGTTDYSPAAVRRYFIILCVPVGLAIIVLMCMPNLPKPVSSMRIPI